MSCCTQGVKHVIRFGHRESSTCGKVAAAKLASTPAVSASPEACFKLRLLAPAEASLPPATLDARDPAHFYRRIRQFSMDILIDTPDRPLRPCAASSARFVAEEKRAV